MFQLTKEEVENLRCQNGTSRAKQSLRSQNVALEAEDLMS